MCGVLRSGGVPKSWEKVHPRMCGVLCQARSAGVSPVGSSPHVRGFVSLTRLYLTESRFIPACAGFWPKYEGRKIFTKVHPRMCGVLAGYMSAEDKTKGSSPHVRGFAPAGLFPARSAGFIPACAGFCTPLPLDRSALLVHPRMCGVLSMPSLLLISCTGSSPHVRGFASIP